MQVYEGYGSKLEVDSDHVRVVRGRLGRMGRPGVVIPLPAVTGASFKPAGLLTNGYLQLHAAGAAPAKPGPSDGFTVVFTRAQEAQFSTVYSWLQQLAQWNRQRSLLAPRPAAAATQAAAGDSTAPAASQPGLSRRIPQTAVRWPRSGGKAGGVRRLNLTRTVTPYPAVSQVYTALDLETTGLDPTRDKIVEIGLVKVTGSGQILDEFTTLISNPGSSREARDVHRIDDADLAGAPSLESVLPEVLAFISGSVVIAHNLAFEEPFLTSALKRQGLPIPDLPAVCTLQTSRRQLEGHAFSLDAMHKTATGQWAENKHTALGDARAAGQVLRWLIDQAPNPLHLDGPPAVGPRVPLTVIPTPITCRPVPLVKASLADLLSAFPQSPTPRMGNPLEVQRYQDLLAQSVDDGRLTFDEARTLTDQAQLTQLTGTQLRDLHRRAWYTTFPDAAAADWATLSATRRREMYLLADGLGLTDLAENLAAVSKSMSEPPPSPEARYLRGLRVAFAGDDPVMSATHQRAVDHGAQIAINITKTVAWLASSTPTSDDRRHTGARGLGIPILTAEQASQRVDEALREAELKAFERQRQLDEQQARARQYAAEQDAYWRATWRARELDHDPEREW